MDATDGTGFYIYLFADHDHLICRAARRPSLGCGSRRSSAGRHRAVTFACCTKRGKAGPVQPRPLRKDGERWPAGVPPSSGQAAVRSIFAHADLPACQTGCWRSTVMAWQSNHLSSCTCRARITPTSQPPPGPAQAINAAANGDGHGPWVDGKPQYRPAAAHAGNPLFAARCLLRLERARRPHPRPAHACYCMFRPRGAESSSNASSPPAGSASLGLI